MNVACLFCKPDDQAFRGDGCCFCDYSGLIPFEENQRFLDPNMPNNEQPYPHYSDIDLEVGRKFLKDKLVEIKK